MEFLSTAETARMIGVSDATVRNWVRAGHLAAASPRPFIFKKEDVLALLERIRDNGFPRLRKRANRSASSAALNPGTRNQKILADMRTFVNRIEQASREMSHAVYAAALHLLAGAGEAILPDEQAAWRFENIVWTRSAVRAVMLGWRDRLGSFPEPVTRASAKTFLSWCEQDIDDPLGLLYQGLSSVGRNSRTGAYFTPIDAIDNALAALRERPKSFLDPCCGTGRYLVRAAKLFGVEPRNLYGFDADPVAVDIARLNILLCHPGVDFMPQVRCLDSLRELANGKASCDTNRLAGAIDAIATNPPWGSAQNVYRRSAPSARDKQPGESFSLFLEKSLHLLREGGELSFLLPESVLKIRAHAGIRRLLLEQTSIVRITSLGRIFPGVLTPVIRLDLIRSAPAPDWKVMIEDPEGVHETAQSHFVSNARQAFDVAVSSVDEGLLEKIFSVRHQTLANQAEWAMGIVTGDNARHVLKSPCEGSEPVFCGRDVRRFSLRPPRCHIVFRPEAFQQVAQERFFRAREKLIYRFVSNQLVFAYDNMGMLTLNSANIVIPHLPEMGIKAVLAFLNSRVFQYIFAKRFQTGKVLRGDLETLPFPFIEGRALREIESRVEQCIGRERSPGVEEELERLVFRAFGLTDSEAALLEERLASDAARPRF